MNKKFSYKEIDALVNMLDDDEFDFLQKSVRKRQNNASNDFKPMSSLSLATEKNFRMAYGDEQFHAMIHGYSTSKKLKKLGVKLCTNHAVPWGKDRVKSGSNVLYGG